LRGFALFLLVSVATPALAEPSGPVDDAPKPVAKAADANASGADEVIATDWSLRQQKKPMRRVARQGGGPNGSSATRPTVVNENKPRIVGGINARSGYRRKSNANVGLAIPF
jgi:hypothetical protein